MAVFAINHYFLPKLVDHLQLTYHDFRSNFFQHVGRYNM